MSKSVLLAHDAACTEFQARALLSASRELLATVSPEGEFLYVNENFSRVLGYSQQEFASLVAGKHNDVVACRCSLRAKSGQVRWFDAIATNRLADPDVQGIII